ncbi:MAG: YecA family protein [Acidobacteriota bacterium]
MWLTFRQIQPLYGSLLSAGPEFYFGLAGKKFQFGLSGRDILFRCYDAPAFEATIESAGLYANIMLLSALLLATPGMRWKKRFLVLGLGLALLSLSHIAFVITKVEITLIAAKHPLAGIESFWRFWDDFFEVMGKEFFPILIWLLLGLRYMLGASDKLLVRSGMLAVGRNARCPCGSGRKYKVCCGRG